MTSAKDHLIVALDVETLGEAKGLVQTIGDAVTIYKVGNQLFTACGPEIVKYLDSLKKKVFLDLKFHDIPNTVANAVRSAVGLNRACAGAPVILCTLHACGGEEMMREAALAAKQQAVQLGVKAPALVGVTVLTSEAKTDNMHALILERARLAKACGLDGVVASSEEAGMLCRECGVGFILVTPGIRLVGDETGDQKRVTTPFQAIQNGSHYLVVGRPIVKAPDPSSAANAILKDIERAFVR